MAKRSSASTSIRRSATVRIPEVFSFDHDIAVTPSTSQVERKNLENACYFILSALSRYRYDHKALEMLEATGYLPLSAVLLKKTCGDRYKMALDLLISAGIIEHASGSYSTGSSRRYRLAKHMAASASVYRELSGTVRERFLRNQEEADQVRVKNPASLTHLTKWLNPLRLTVDLQRAHSFIELSFRRVHELINASEFSEAEKLEARGRAHVRMNQQINDLRLLANGVYQVSNDGKDERLHSVLTRVKKELRSFLLYDGQPLVSLDIRSSQPYFFTKLLSRKFYSMTVKNPLGFKSLVQGPQHTPSTPLLPPTPPPDIYSSMFPTLTELTDEQLLTRSSFRQFSWESGFYKQFAEQLNTTATKHINEAQAKKLAMFLFFEYRPYKFRTEQFRSFERLYPLEAGVIRGMNRLEGKLLPIMLQRLESRVMLHHVSKTIAAVLPEAPLFSVHDSLLTPPQYAAAVKNMMVTELTTIMGLQPGIKEESKDSEDELQALESFAHSILEDTLKSVRQWSKAVAQGLPNAYSFAGENRDEPLLRQTPEYNGEKIVFNPYYYDSEEE
ncbi:hypothetical protein EJV47_00575 [Hymenobacter gummosus]|uniref:Uncharacterized protein n=1 Tax=Hymenobacter gummosus TaxID=1776032 RepID=A0A431U8W2_9BACT|nr:hypothetical protein [Hymenobacter gummosus]RTQ53266.1 hypothetical protein EJV47_00575 [Hymenobacter gummosus]